MLACYLDEAGDDAALPTGTSTVPPLMCVLGLVLDLDRVREFTHRFVDLKARFFPGKYGSCTRLERILTEVKGSELRTAFRLDKPAEHARRHTHIGFLDSVLDLAERFECHIFGRVWIKAIGKPLGTGIGVYAYSAQYICSTFDKMLSGRGGQGIVVPDSRTKREDREISFRVFTQKFSSKGDGFRRIVEAPTFAQSANHAGLQVCDILCSGLLFPIAAYAYCGGYHADTGYKILKNRYSLRLCNLQQRYYDTSRGRHAGGITVSDDLNQRGGGHLFH